MAPNKSTVDFSDKKQRYSIGCQGVCDGNLNFSSMSAGYPGAAHDSCVLRNTLIFHQANNGTILNTPAFKVKNKTFRRYIIGDPAYPPLDWLLKPFLFSNYMDRTQRRFNYCLCKARVSIKRAFGTLKESWRILNQNVPLRPSYAADTVFA
eukprot:gene13435-14816_t